MYSDWGIAGEKGLLGNCCSAIERLLEIMHSLPPYVIRSLESKAYQEELLNNTAPINGDANGTVTTADFDELVLETNDYIAPPSQYEGIAGVELRLQQSGVLLRNVNESNIAFLKNYLINTINSVKATNTKKVSLTIEENVLQTANPSLVFEVDGIGEKEAELQDIVTKFNTEQLTAYTIICTHVSDPHSSQMILFLSGPGGTGTLVTL